MLTIGHVDQQLDENSCAQERKGIQIQKTIAIVKEVVDEEVEKQLCKSEPGCLASGARDGNESRVHSITIISPLTRYVTTQRAFYVNGNDDKSD